MLRTRLSLPLLQCLAVAGATLTSALLTKGNAPRTAHGTTWETNLSKQVVCPESREQMQHQVQFYRRTLFNGMFSGSKDFVAISAVLGFYNRSGWCAQSGKQVTIILGGANEGQSAANVLKFCPGARMDIFEIQRELIPKLKTRFHGFNVDVENVGFNDIATTMQVTFPGAVGTQLAGLFPTSWRNGSQSSSYSVSVVPLSEYIDSKNISDPIDYVLIDVEGHEPNAIRGMRLDLERYRRAFPVIQFELGGTWQDSRHDANERTLREVAKYLESLDYALFLMGAEQEAPLLLRVLPEFFQEFDLVTGNALAVHKLYADHSLWAALHPFIQCG